MKLLECSRVKSLLFCSLLSSFSVLSAELSEHEPNVKNESPQQVTTLNTIIENNEKAKQKLVAKLSEIKFFSADFEQTIIDADGNLIQSGEGELSVSKPNLIHWATKTPDESLIVSDGSTLWFYDPFIEQVSAYNLDGAIANTPILLLTSDSPELWQHYDVREINGNTFIIETNDTNSRIKTLEIHLSQREQQGLVVDSITGFTFLDATGQLSVIKLRNIDDEDAPEKTLFEFLVPEGVHLDDQR